MTWEDSQNSLAVNGSDGYAPSPHNISAEQALLGALLIDNRLLADVEASIDRDSFYDPVHAALYAAMVQSIAAGREATPVTMRPTVQSWPPINADLEVWQYLFRLAAETPSLRIRDHVRCVADMAARRRIVSAAQDMIGAAIHASSDAPVEDMVAAGEQALFDIVARRIEGREVSIVQAVDQAIDVLDNACARGGAVAGVPTGLIDLDKMLGGLQNSDLVILGGRPSMGKTSLCMTIAYAVARLPKISADGEIGPPHHVLVFSLEMSASQIAMRIIGEQSEVSSDRLRRGDVDEQQYRSVIDAARTRVQRAAMMIDETGGISLPALAAKARRAKRKHDTRMIVIDYLQLMSGAPGRYSDGRVQELTKITMGLKALAKELDVPILVVSQLSRKVEDRADKRPQMSDLRESGSIEQDADVVMLVYRDEYYAEREKPDESDPVKFAAWQARMNAVSGKAEVIVAKHRHGQVGTVPLAFEAQFTRFGNLGRAQGVDYGR